MLGGSSKTDDFVISGEESVLLAADFVKGKKNDRIYGSMLLCLCYNINRCVNCDSEFIR